MPWVRIDENAMDHPKIGGLSDGAFRLWVQGLAYCQKYLTDGHIGDVALRSLRAYSPKRKADLLVSELWHASETGVRVHDYLQWNDSREHVMAARQFARERMQKRRSSSVDVQANAHVNNGERSPNVPSGVCIGGSSVERGLGKTAPRSVVPTMADLPEDVALRAGRFVTETYPTLYQKLRRGAKYISKPALDFDEAAQLCAIWDDARLEKLATVFLTTDHAFAESGSRTMAQFRSLASWCDSQLTERGL